MLRWPRQLQLPGPAAVPDSRVPDSAPEGAVGLPSEEKMLLTFDVGEEKEILVTMTSEADLER